MFIEFANSINFPHDLQMCADLNLCISVLREWRKEMAADERAKQVPSFNCAEKKCLFFL
jgi:hypothetical protein